MKGRGLVFRSTMALGVGFVGYHFFGKGLLGRYSQVAPGFSGDDDDLLNPDIINKNIEARKKEWKEKKLDQIAEKSTTPILEDLERKDGINELRLRKVTTILFLFI